jgi:acyl-CoA synthetase (AMP-forming)/AMP-acid ligase II
MVAPGARDADGWLHTGDLGSLDDGGRLVVLGRARDVIVTGGEKVAPDGVEEALRAHPEVMDAGVAGRPDPEWGQAVTAWVVAGPAGVGDEELLAFLRVRLAPHEVPKRIHRVASLPRNAAGKLERRLL